MPKPICYTITKAELPFWDPNDKIYEKHPLGYGYETETHFIHIFGNASGYFPIQIGLTVIEKKEKDIFTWVKDVFGAQNILEMDNEPGETIEGVWRPSLYYEDDLRFGLNYSAAQMKYSEQAIRHLIDKLDDIFKYIEPETVNFPVFGYKIRELLVLSCTEVENIWQYYMNISSTPPQNGKMYTTNDYVKLVKKLFLKEYQIKLKSYETLPPLSPFIDWDPNMPTASLTWYDAYNKVKHDRESNFAFGNLLNALNSVCACLIMHIVHFGPWAMLEQNNTFSSIVNQHFDFSLSNPNIQSFYLHKIILPENTRTDRFAFDPKRAGFTQIFHKNNLFL
jgi:hypothetical protein